MKLNFLMTFVFLSLLFSCDSNTNLHFDGNVINSFKNNEVSTDDKYVTELFAISEASLKKNDIVIALYTYLENDKKIFMKINDKMEKFTDITISSSDRLLASNGNFNIVLKIPYKNRENVDNSSSDSYSYTMKDCELTISSRISSKEKKFSLFGAGFRY